MCSIVIHHTSYTVPRYSVIQDQNETFDSSEIFRPLLCTINVFSYTSKNKWVSGCVVSL
jgi:hypothetical protein